MYFEEIPLHWSRELKPVVMEKEKMMAFAREYDPIPLHLDEEYAKTTMFKGLIAPGVMSFMTMWANYLEQDVVGEHLIAGKSTKIEWHKPVYAGDALHGRAEITRLVKRSARNGLVEVTIEAYNQNNVLVLTNVTEAIVRCKEVSQPEA